MTNYFCPKINSLRKFIYLHVCICSYYCWLSSWVRYSYIQLCFKRSSYLDPTWERAQSVSKMIQSSSTRTEDRVAQPLLSSWENDNVNRCSQSCCPLRFICIPSKTIFLLLASTLVVSESHCLTHVTVAAFISEYIPMGQYHLVNSLSFPLSLVCAFLAVIGIFYPLSGFLADVYFGRFKIIVSSLTLILISFTIISVTSAVRFSLTTLSKIWHL